MDFPLNSIFDRPTAPTVPMITAAIVLTNPMIMVLPSTVQSSVSLISFAYHLKVKPCQIVLFLLSLNENTIITITGIYRNANTRNPYMLYTVLNLRWCFSLALLTLFI